MSGLFTTPRARKVGQIVPYSTVREKQNELIRKALDGSTFITPRSTSNLTSITTGSGADLVTLTNWEDLGWTNSDGVTFGRAIETSDVPAFGSQEPVRSDITSDTTTLQVVALETKLLTLGLYYNIDTTGLQAAATTGEFKMLKPTKSADLHYRVLALFVDESDDGEIYIARYLPNAKITERAEVVYSSGDDPIQYGLTFTAFNDAAAGTSEAYFFGGPGWKALLTQMGITQAP
jgi:hypothetical protein